MDQKALGKKVLMTISSSLRPCHEDDKLDLISTDGARAEITGSKKKSSSTLEVGSHPGGWRKTPWQVESTRPEPCTYNSPRIYTKVQGK